MFLFAGLSACDVLADAAGLALAEKVYNRPNGRDVTLLGRMVLTEKGHTPRERAIVTYRIEKSRTETSNLVRFLEPEDIAETGLLSVDDNSGETKQWLYLPELDRVRRISGSRKGGRFVGSDLYYEDLIERKPAEDTHRIIGNETIAGVPCEILESVPIDQGDSVYSRRVAWIDPRTLLAMRIDLYERDADRPDKRLVLVKKERIQGYWTVTDSRMTDLRSGHETRITVETAIYDRKLPTSLFTPQTLADPDREAEYRP